MRVLIVRIGAMGDVLHAMPAVAALRQEHPDWFIGWAIEPVWSELLQSASHPAAQSARHSVEIPLRDVEMPLVDRLYRVPTRTWKKQPFTRMTLRSIATLRRELRADRYDLCVDMQGSIRSAVIGRMAGAKVFAGSDEPREAPASWLYGQRVKLSATHVVDRGCELLGAAVGEALRPAKVQLPIDSADERWCNALLAREDSRVVVIAPTAGWGAKQWPAERYGSVAAELSRAGFRVMVNAVSPGDEVGLRVVEASGELATLVPCSLGQLVALLRKASLVIAGDTGPLHLAAALAIPLLALFGPTDPGRNGPYGNEAQARVLRDESSTTDHSRRAEAEPGLLKISVSEVTEAALELLQAGQDKVKV